MKTVRQWFEELPEPYRTQALANTEEEMLDIDDDSVAGSLLGAFRWDSSLEGHEYWQDISDTLFNQIQIN